MKKLTAEETNAIRQTWNRMDVPALPCMGAEPEPRYTAAQIIAAAEEGELCMIDARYIVEILERSKTTEP